MSSQRGDAVRFALLVAAWLGSAAPVPAADYALEPAESRLEFQAEQQGARFRGRFEDFSARLSLDEAGGNALEATVRVGSVNTDYEERDGYLRGEEWFDAARFPEARFVTQRLEAAGDGSYRAEAQLTIRDVTRPVTLPLRFDGRRLRGELAIDRRDFGIGQGMWADDRMVGAEVTIFIDVAFRPAT